MGADVVAQGDARSRRPSCCSPEAARDAPCRRSVPRALHLPGTSLRFERRPHVRTDGGATGVCAAGACEYGARLVDQPDQRRGPTLRSMVGRAADGDAEPAGPDRRGRAIAVTAIGITALLTGGAM